MVVLTSPEKAQAITHSGTMHADEVMATAILARAFGQNLRVARVPRVPENIRSDVIVYDIGYGRFDHHQCGGNGTRGNGIPYASAGLIWREFGPRITAGTADPEYVWKCVDRSVIAGIDAADCGETKWVQGPQPINLTTLISGFNLPWNCCGDLGKEFIKAVEYAGVALDHAIVTTVEKR